MAQILVVSIKTTTVAQSRRRVTVCEERSGYHFLQGRRGRVRGVSGPDDLRLEPAVFVSGVVDCSGGAVGFNQLVVTFNLVAYTFLSLLLDVLSVFVLHSVLELVLSRSLKRVTNFMRKKYFCGTL
jgi:hypothetical protein